MSKGVELTIGMLAIVTTLVSGTVVVENRYAKAAEMQASLDTLWSKTLKLKILELELKPADQFTTNDKALLDHLKQELKEATDDR